MDNLVAFGRDGCRSPLCLFIFIFTVMAETRTKLLAIIISLLIFVISAPVADSRVSSSVAGITDCSLVAWKPPSATEAMAAI